MRDFASMDEFLVFLATRIGAVEDAQRHGLDVAARIVKAEAKAEIGIYQAAVWPFEAWRELAPRTKEERHEQGFPENEPLLRDGILRDSIEHSGDSHRAHVGVPDKMVQHSYRKAPDNIGDIAVWQEFGTDRIPPRSFLGGAAARKADEAVTTIAREVVYALAGTRPNNI